MGFKGSSSGNGSSPAALRAMFLDLANIHQKSYINKRVKNNPESQQTSSLIKLLVNKMADIKRNQYTNVK